MKQFLLVTLFILSGLGLAFGQTTYEAEDGTLTEATISTEGSGFSGSGYIVFEQEGSVSVSINVENEGYYPLTIGYRAAFGEKIQDLYVNGTLVQNVVFPEGENFTNLNTDQFFLNAGENTLEIRANYGYMDLDYFRVGVQVDPGTYQAEDATIIDATVSSEGTGFSGSGFVVFEATGSVSITLDAAAAGMYELTLGYRSGFGEKIQDLYVNDILVQNVVFPQGDSFTSLNTDLIPLNAGSNTISIQANYGYMDLDYFKLGSRNVPNALEAEDGTLTGVTTNNVAPGFSGEGYVVFEAGGSVLVSLERESEGLYPLTLGYRSVYGEKIQNLYVNGDFVRDITFPGGDDFTTLDTEEILLNVGVNTIEIRASYGYMDLDYFLVGLETSPAPIANAGFQQVKMDVDGDGMETLILDASASSDPNDDIVSYTWFSENGDTLGTGEQLSYTATLGGYELTLEVADAMGNVDRDQVKVFVGDPTNNGNNRISLTQGTQLKFSDGINLAWNNFARDIVDLDPQYFEGIMDSIEAAGGNTMRWWLHTNGSNSPQFDAAGNVTGLDPNTIPNMRTVLDLAYNRGIAISMCLWSFDMLQPQGQDQQVMKALLEDPAITQTYIENALIPILEEIGDHPAVLSWEIFNEPEGMTEEFGYTPVRTAIRNVQQFINLTVGAIHRTVPTAQVSSGAANFETMTDIEGHTNYYRDDRLIAVGGDPLGTLDFYQVHYYPSNFDIDLSPFHRPADWWGLDKPIVIGEFPSRAIDEVDAPSYTILEAYQLAYEYGYAGSNAWDFRGFDGGSFETAREGITYLADTYPEDIDLEIDPDRINEPPSIVANISDLNLFLENAQSVENYVALDTIFYDAQDMTDLVYSISANSNPAIANAEITDDGTLNVLITQKQEGNTTLTVKATDTKGASAYASFNVNIRESNGNLALFKPISASSIENASLIETFANDGDAESRWSSVYENDEWIYVDLQESMEISSVKLLWESAFGQSYEIQISDDAVNWETVYTESNGDGGTDDITLELVTTRYVRMYGHTRATEFGFSLYEFEIYGSQDLNIQDENLQLVLYPNPLKTANLNLKMTNIEPVTVSFMNLLGKIITTYCLEGKTNYVLDASSMASGMFLIKISSEKGSITKKIIKQ
ncbi:CBM35 domain-containing protein [Flavimarina sp. Hel_I_48]|uniref:CBM35 domain-containing protein n=1 Tax=Flavimarina sp. Hel_I_48 TaxID=1392488 RepID=UPI00068EB516|nr:CBM35 domain-containing protein [Flavimarina sp. Hel_I_48]